MKLDELRSLLKDKRVIEEINKHLWIESQKAGYSIGIERATDEWLKLYAESWLKYHEPVQYKEVRTKKKAAKAPQKKSAPKKKAVKKSVKKIVKKKAAKKSKKK